MPTAQPPIGVFDSGVGGLSVLQALRAELPHERFVYLADSGNAPYGERGDAFVAERTHAITDYLLQRHSIKALVMACNTATAAAIHEARSRHPTLPVVGVEPALKPAVMASKTKRIGVIGTRGTLTSTKFAKLLASLHGQAEFIVQPCDGLAHAGSGLHPLCFCARRVAPPARPCDRTDCNRGAGGTTHATPFGSSQHAGLGQQQARLHFCDHAIDDGHAHPVGKCSKTLAAAADALLRDREFACRLIQYATSQA